MGFFGSLFTGSNPTLSGDIANAGQIRDYGTNLGERDLSQGSDFWSGILSGNPDAIAKLLGPQMSEIQKQGQQALQTGAQFHNRSGGTNAATQQNMDSQRAEIERMISALTGAAGGEVTKIGEFGLNTALGANSLQAQEAQQQMENQQNSIFGGILGGLGNTVGSFLSGGLSKLLGGIHGFRPSASGSSVNASDPMYSGLGF